MKSALSSRAALAFTGGWRWADAPELKNGGTPLYNYESYIFDHHDTPVNVDFSGVTAQGSVDFAF